MLKVYYVFSLFMFRNVILLCYFFRFKDFKGYKQNSFIHLQNAFKMLTS